jgi:hypothetical protein
MSKSYRNRHLIFLALVGGSSLACQSVFADTSADADADNAGAASHASLTSLNPVLVTAMRRSITPSVLGVVP